MFELLEMGFLLGRLEPPALYRMAIEQVFFNKKEGPAVESLRETAKALLVTGKPFRLTKEFDALIDLGEI
jgi:hypothetical protein